MITEYATAFEQLNIEREVFDEIIADEGARQEIAECLFFCLEKVPAVEEIASCLMQYMASHSEENKDGGPGSGNFGHEGRPGSVGGSAKGNGPSISSEMKPAATYSYKNSNGDVLDFHGWIRENTDLLQDTFDSGGMDAVKQEYYKGLTDQATGELHHIEDAGDAHDAIADAVGDAALDGWFRDANSEYKPRIITRLLSDSKARNAALSVMYDNFRSLTDGQETFEEFLTKPIKMYRGGHGQQHTKADVYLAYSFSREVAEKFAGSDGRVYEAEIRPIDTWGSVYGNKESEIMVPAWIAPNGNIDNADGGPGSGNFGHNGVPGQVGGSAPSKGDPISNSERKSLVAFTGDSNAITTEQATDIERAITKAPSLSDQFEYSRGLALTKQQIDDLLESGVYSPGKLTSWTPDESVATNFAYDGAAWDDSKYPVVIKYRGTKQLDKGMEVSEYSQHPEEDEAVFSSSIRMKVEKSEVSGYDPGDDEPYGVVYINLYDDGRNDGGPGSGNFNHQGRPGEIGGSAPGNESRAVVHGKDISQSYKGPTDIKSIIKVQGFDGLPKIVKKDEFDKAVKASKFVAQRVYTASSQEILDAYRDQLYNGEWYVECSTGGAQYGQGMYCASDYEGNLSEGIENEIEHYAKTGDSRYGQKLTDKERCEKAVEYLKNWQGDHEHYPEMEEYVRAQFSGDWKRLSEAEKKITSHEIALANVASDEVPTHSDAPEYIETLTLDPSAKIITHDEISDEYESARRKARKDSVARAAEDLKDSLPKFKNGSVDSTVITVAGLRLKAMKESYFDRKATKRSIDSYESFMDSDEKKAAVKLSRAAEKIMDESFPKDVGAFAAMKGYDAIKAEGHGESGSYTVVLNRSKVLFLDDRANEDAADDDSTITFQLGPDGVIYAIRNRKVIGTVNVYTINKPVEERKDGSGRKASPMNSSELRSAFLGLGCRLDGGPGSGNWGHEGREGKVGGSAPSDGAKEVGRGESRSSPALEKAHWKEGFPKVTVHTNLQTLRHSDPELHNRAKHGDVHAAGEIISKCVKPERIQELARKYPDAKVVPVLNEDTEEGNQIPLAFAGCFEDYGLEVDTEIIQTKKAGHTDADQFRRLTSRPQFGGEVEPGKKYILVDDHITNGGTINDLRKFIESKGGEVVAVSTLSASKGGTFIAIQKKTVDAVYEKHGKGIDDLLRKAGISYDVASLTDREGRYILSMNPETLKRRIEDAKG